MILYTRMAIVGRLTDGRILINDFIGGGRIVRPRRPRRMTEEDVLAYALWLTNRGRGEEADEFLEDYLQGRSGMIRH